MTKRRSPKPKKPRALPEAAGYSSLAVRSAIYELANWLTNDDRDFMYLVPELHQIVEHFAAMDPELKTTFQL